MLIFDLAFGKDPIIVEFLLFTDITFIDPAGLPTSLLCILAIGFRD